VFRDKPVALTGGRAVGSASTSSGQAHRQAQPLAMPAHPADVRAGTPATSAKAGTLRLTLHRAAKAYSTHRAPQTMLQLAPAGTGV